MLECEIGSPSYCLYLCKLENWQLHDIALLFFSHHQSSEQLISYTVSRPSLGIWILLHSSWTLMS